LNHRDIYFISYSGSSIELVQIKISCCSKRYAYGPGIDLLQGKFLIWSKKSSRRDAQEAFNKESLPIYSLRR